MMELILILTVIILLLIIYWLIQKSKNLQKQVEDLISKKQSLATKYGMLTEQFMPLLETYPYNNENFRFIGNPIDGIQFESDKIIFVEFKAADSKLTIEQKQIKGLVLKKKVEFEEIRIPPKK